MIVNDRDLLLQKPGPRFNTAGTGLILKGVSTIRTAADGSSPNPASITLSAVLLGVSGTPSWSVSGAILSGNDSTSRTLAASSMAGDVATVVVSLTYAGVLYSDEISIAKVRDGVVGSTTYTWIKYADSAVGAGLSDDPTGKAYIGLAYNKSSPIESTIASDYTWSLIKGEDGQPGEKGADGVQLYTWIKYSDSANGNALYDVPTANTLYIGIAVNKTTATESSNPADYVWSRFKGDQGVPGPALYTWIKYADSAAGANLSDDPTGKAYIGFAYNKTTAVESDSPADYTWSLNQGGQGVPGQPGKDGTTYYTWIKYSDAPDGTGLYDVPTASTMYIGIAVNKVTPTESTSKGDYTWSKFKGDQGVPGNPGQPGQRGTVDISAGTAGTAWSDSEATAAIAQTGYGTPQMLDVVTLYNQAAGFANTRYWNGSAWIPVSQVINGSLLVKNTVAADKIDSRGLSLKDAAGNVILAAGSALSKDYAAPGTLNIDLVPSISAAQTTANLAEARDVSNLVKKFNFDDGVSGGWGSGAETSINGWNSEAVPAKGQLVTNSRDKAEYGNSFPITSGETLSFSAWMCTQDTPYSGYFGVFVYNKNGTIIQYMQAIGLSATKQWTYLEGSAVVAPGGVVAVPWLQQDGFDFVGKGYLRATNMWIGRHARGATVGAPAGTYVGNSLAQNVESWAQQGVNAANALPAINTAIGKKLQADSYAAITGQFSLQASAAILVGTINDGIVIGSGGMYGRKGGYTQFGIGADGTATFAGALLAPSGSLGSLSIAPGGNIRGGSYAAYAWPAAGGTGFYLGPEGLLIGNFNNGRYFQATGDGNVFMPGVRVENGQATLTNPIIIQPKMQTSLSVALPNLRLTNQANGSVSSSVSPVVSNASGTVRYSWSLSSRDGGPNRIYLSSSPSAASAGVAASGSNTWLYAYLTLTVYDDSGATATATCDITIQFGSGVQS